MHVGHQGFFRITTTLVWSFPRENGCTKPSRGKDTLAPWEFAREEASNPVAASEHPFQKPMIGNLWSPAYHIQVDRSGSQSTAQSLRQQQKTDADAELTLQHGIVLITPPSTPHSETARLIADDLSATVARRLSRDRRGDQTRITSQTNPQMMTLQGPAISFSLMWFHELLTNPHSSTARSLTR